MQLRERGIGRGGSEAGFSIVEILMVVALMGVLMSIVLIQAGASIPVLKGDGAMRVILAQMRTARDLSVAQRRYMRVTFTLPNEIAIIREEVPGPATTVMATTPLEGDVQFLISASRDTGDGFGMSRPIDFGAATSIKFAPDGTLVNQVGQTINGSAFLAIPGAPRSARAITVMGSTGRIRAWRWDGLNWKAV